MTVFFLKKEQIKTKIRKVYFAIALQENCSSPNACLAPAFQNPNPVAKIFCANPFMVLLQIASSDLLHAYEAVEYSCCNRADQRMRFRF